MIDLKEFMTGQEKEQINQILDRAERRMKRQHTNDYRFLECQCEIYEQMPKEQREQGSSQPGMREFLSTICRFCQENGCCCQCWKGDEREEEEDELPF